MVARPCVLSYLGFAVGLAACGGDGQEPRSWSVAVEAGTDVGTFFGTWGPNVRNLYAVGGQSAPAGQSSTGAMFRRDGAAWEAVALPPDTSMLSWVTGVGNSRFVVGELGTVLRRQGDDDAVGWEVERCDTNLTLWGVWGAAPDDVWAVGGDGASRPPVLCHFDGSAWELVSVPPLTVMSRGLFKVWGSDANNVVAVGHRGLILRFDGEVWTEQSSGTELDLISLWGTGPDDILAVGGRSQGVLTRYDGEVWTAVEFEDLPGLNGVWMDSNGDATVVGGLGLVGTVGAGTFELEVQPAPNALALHAVFGFEAGQRIAVGGSFDVEPPFEGVILQR